MLQKVASYNFDDHGVLMPTEHAQNTLSEPQIRAARMMAMGIPYNEIAFSVGIDRTTIFRWRKTKPFKEELTRLNSAASQASEKRVVRDVAEINDVILTTLLDVAENDVSGAARVSAARVLSGLVERAEERASRQNHDVMRDQSSEIRELLLELRSEH